MFPSTLNLCVFNEHNNNNRKEEKRRWICFGWCCCGPENSKQNREPQKEKKTPLRTKYGGTVFVFLHWFGSIHWIIPNKKRIQFQQIAKKNFHVLSIHFLGWFFFSSVRNAVVYGKLPLKYEKNVATLGNGELFFPLVCPCHCATQCVRHPIEIYTYIRCHCTTVSCINRISMWLLSLPLWLLLLLLLLVYT